MSMALSGRPADLRSAIDRFLQERLDGKLKLLADDDPKRAALCAQFDFTTWIDDAASRVGQIQAVTHALKATHPYARGTSLYRPPASLPAHSLVGSHCLNDDFTGDVVGNAAALDVYKFLRIDQAGDSLLELMRAGDADLLAALSEDTAQAQAWMRAFTSITAPRGKLSSHTQAKQIYWLVGEDSRDDAGYHLLAPVYASSLVHEVFQTINEDRFGETAKAARQARREGSFSEEGVHEYPHLAVQKLGGTKPQNVSQLNSERGGNNYLLASLPPLWVARGVTPPLRTDTVFKRFGRRDGVKAVIRELRAFLESNPPPTMIARDFRDALVLDVIEELFQLELQLRSLPPGWSASRECDLPAAERFWLDARRGDTDRTFASQLLAIDWPKDLCDRFAAWLNSQLSEKLTMGDPEHDYWYSLLKDQFEARRRGGAYD